MLGKINQFESVKALSFKFLSTMGILFTYLLFIYLISLTFYTIYSKVKMLILVGIYTYIYIHFLSNLTLLKQIFLIISVF